MEGLRRMADDKDDSKFIETIQHFRLIDDTYFNNFMDGNLTCMQLFLRIIMDEPELEVLHIQTQREVSNIYGRSVRFDVFVKDAAGDEYDIEVQRSDAWATPERARYNSSMLDAMTVKKGFEWGKDHLPPAHVIFITEHDILKGGKPIYHSYRTIAELNHLRLEDYADVIYVNAEIQDDTALGRLMHDMFCENPSDMYYQELAARSRYFKTNEDGVRMMCEAMEKLIEERSIEEKKETILRLAAEGASLHILSVAVKWPQKKVEEFLRSQNLQPAQ